MNRVVKYTFSELGVEVSQELVQTGGGRLEVIFRASSAGHLLGTSIKSISVDEYLNQRSQSPKLTYWHDISSEKGLTERQVPTEIIDGAKEAPGWVRFCRIHGISPPLGDLECDEHDDDQSDVKVGTLGFDPVTEKIYLNRPGTLVTMAATFAQQVIDEQKIEVDVSNEPEYIL